MKKLLCFLVLAAFAATGSLFAQQGGFVNPSPNKETPERGGFQGASGARRAQPVTVAQAKTLADDTVVLLRGSIVKHVKKDKYLFKGQAGEETILIEIDDDKWNGRTVTPEDLIVIVGEVDKDDGQVKIDVKSIRKHNPAEKGRGAGGKGVRNPEDRPGKGNRGEGRQGGERRGAPAQGAE